MDYSLDLLNFCFKYGQDYPKVAIEEARTEYEKYKDFYAKYHQDNPGATTDCYAEFLETHGKQASSTRFIGRIEEQREKSLNTVTGFVLYCKRGSWALLVGT